MRIDHHGIVNAAVPRLPKLVIKYLGNREYVSVWDAMKDFNRARQAHTPDEFWVVEHPAVFTQGLNGKAEHILNAGHIPVVQVDRGGQVTYHGPGQVVIYLLVDLRRKGLGVRQLVRCIEQSIIDLLATHDVHAEARKDAPGVYIDGGKIAALGLRVSRGCAYHGLAFNVDMDLRPFERINPCGYPGLPVTQLKDLGVELAWDEVAGKLCAHLQRALGYTDVARSLSGLGRIYCGCGK